MPVITPTRISVDFLAEKIGYIDAESLDGILAAITEILVSPEVEEKTLVDELTVPLVEKQKHDF